MAEKSGKFKDGRKFKVPSCKFKVKSPRSNFELATWNFELN
jgi:hypothetical protein